MSCQLLWVFGVAVVVLQGCGGTSAPAQPSSNQPSTNQPSSARPRFFSAGSPLNLKISAAAAVDPRSDSLLASLRSSASQGFVLGWRSWSIPVYYVDAGTPRHDVTMTQSWAPKQKLLNVPIPDGARPDPEADASLCLVDLTAGCEWDLWETKQSGGAWSAGWANAISITGSGIYPRGLSARGSGFALLAGLIFPDELAAGEIPHALVFSFDHTKAGGPVAPATESDGESTRADAIPEGALLQLDPNLDLETLGLAPYQRTIARALQVYGMYLVDNGGGVSLYAANPLSLPAGSYDGLLPDEEFPDLSAIPIDRFRVLLLPAQNPDPPLAVDPSGCAAYE